VVLFQNCFNGNQNNNEGYPEYLKTKLGSTLYTERQRPNYGKFYDSSRGKIGRHKLENRLEIMDNLEWVPANKSNNAIRLKLKGILISILTRFIFYFLNIN